MGEDIVYSLINIAKARVLKDIYAYAEKYTENNEAKVRLILRSPDNSAETGCRFKYIDPIINFTYNDLVTALNKAIDREAIEHNGELVTDEREASVEVREYDYDALYAEFESLVGELINRNQDYFTPRIIQITDKYLGKGKKVSETTLDQAEFIYLINAEIKADLIPKQVK